MLENEIRRELNIEDNFSTDIYKDAQVREDKAKKIASIVNNHIKKIAECHDKKSEAELNEKGCLIIENFLSDEEVDEILDSIKDEPGYNYHIAANAYNQEPKVYSKDLNWNIFSYKPDILLRSKKVLQKFTDEKFISLIQSYLGCFPTLYSVNCVWSKFTGDDFKTQVVHRDYDDYRFLAFFVILTDIDDNNGPHVFYPYTQNGEEISSEPVIVKGKKGTAFLADTFAYHNGMPLLERDRCLLWVRFGLHINNVHFKNKDNEYKQDKSIIFKHIPDNEHNRYLLRAFVKEEV